MSLRAPLRTFTFCSASALVATGSLGCSTFSQIAAGPAVGSERGQGLAGASIAAHYGYGGHHHSGSGHELTNAALPVGIGLTTRVAPTTRFTSFAMGGGYYLTADVRKHLAYGRVEGLLFCNASDSVFCGGGVRVEAGFGISLGEELVTQPGYFVQESARERSYVTVGLFAEYGGKFTRRTEIPMAGIEVGYAYESVVIDLTRGQRLR